MLIISFGWTAAALISGAKTCTRRDWPEEYARKFKEGMVVQSWDHSPRVGGHVIGLARLTRKPYKESTANMPDEDYENEGLGWMERQGIMIRGIRPREFWESWKAAGELVYVVRFKKLDVSDGIFYR